VGPTEEHFSKSSRFWNILNNLNIFLLSFMPKIDKQYDSFGELLFVKPVGLDVFNLDAYFLKFAQNC
jgi:hypothetical protein